MRKTHSPNPKGTSEVRGRISLPSVRISQWRRPSDYWTLLYSILILIKWGPYLKNKGLEFPGVFGCYPLLNWCQIGPLFITLTRAKQQPHLFCFILDSSWMKKNWLSYLIPISQSWRSLSALFVREGLSARRRAGCGIHALTARWHLNSSDSSGLQETTLPTDLILLVSCSSWNCVSMRHVFHNSQFCNGRKCVY